MFRECRGVYMHSRFYAGLLSVLSVLAANLALAEGAGTVPAEGAGTAVAPESGNNTDCCQNICGGESLKFDGPGLPGTRDFLRAFSERYPDPQIAAWLSLKNLPDASPESVQYPPDDEEEIGDDDSGEAPELSDQISEFFSARMYKAPENGRFFALSISYAGEPFAGNFCFFRYDDAAREFVPAGDFPKRRYDGFQGLHYRYLIGDSGSISLETFFMYDKNGVPLYSLEQVFEWDGSEFAEKLPTLYTGRKLLSPASPDGKWDRLALYDIDGDSIPEIFLSLSDTGARDVFYGNGRTDRLSVMKTVPAEFLFTGNGVVARDASGLNVSYTLLRNSAPDGRLTVSCQDAAAPESCVMRLNGSRAAEDQAAEFLAGFAEAVPAVPDYISIQGVVTEEVLEDEDAAEPGPEDVGEEPKAD